MTASSAIDILLVEDNPDDVELTLRTFQEHNLADRVHVVRDGVEALDFLLGSEGATPRPLPKLVLLDLKLPRVDGLEVLRRVRAQPRLHSLPIVVLTSSREERDVVDSYNLGVNSYIVKPVDSDQFTEVVKYLGHYWLLLNQTGPKN